MSKRTAATTTKKKTDAERERDTHTCTMWSVRYFIVFTLSGALNLKRVKTKFHALSTQKKCKLLLESSQCQSRAFMLNDFIQWQANEKFPFDIPHQPTDQKLFNAIPIFKCGDATLVGSDYKAAKNIKYTFWASHTAKATFCLFFHVSLSVFLSALWNVHAQHRTLKLYLLYKTTTAKREKKALHLIWMEKIKQVLNTLRLY